MTPPTPKEVTEYALSIGFKLDGEAFCDYYETRGWIPSGAKKQMSSWQAAVRTWKRNTAAKQTPSVSKDKFCFRCGGNVGPDGKVRFQMLYKEGKPWCTLNCYEKWVREGRP
jgi:hypothetical protein